MLPNIPEPEEYKPCTFNSTRKNGVSINEHIEIDASMHYKLEQENKHHFTEDIIRHVFQVMDYKKNRSNHA